MTDFILADGDTAMFLPTFGVAVVIVRPGILKGSGPATLGGKKLCVDGDEKKLTVPGCTYMTPQYSIPGLGTLSIESLAPNQKATKTQTGGKAVLLKGTQFTAKFEVMTPAMQPPAPPAIPSPVPDAMRSYTGMGMFITTNLKFQGT